jgi:hypothetical protein
MENSFATIKNTYSYRIQVSMPFQSYEFPIPMIFLSYESKKPSVRYKIKRNDWRTWNGKLIIGKHLEMTKWQN